ncbi:MAG: ASCH domain-containing protein [Tissierellia bacterium]|nr:ASCH domain-containing protein [Tissierellia bacterium]
MKPQEIWELFKGRENLDHDSYEAWSFGKSLDELAELVIKGIKRGTSSAHPHYLREGERLPEAGDYSVILNSSGEALCVIRNKKVSILPFRDISEGHARIEGEGDGSLSHWREVHIKFFEEESRTYGFDFNEDMLVVFEEFELVFRP